MTSNEYIYYSNLACKMFRFINSEINMVNSSCELSVMVYDYIGNRYGEIRFPNCIVVMMGNIIDSWNETWTMYLDKKSYIETMIAWTMAHELFHADQFLSMINYTADEEYRNKVEGDVERKSYEWVANNQCRMNEIFGTNININAMTSENMPDVSMYERASVKDFYLQTIANIVIKDFDLFKALKVFTDDEYCSDIILIFNGIDTVAIKINNSYVKENIPLFNSIVAKHCSAYDHYSIYVDVSFGYNSADKASATVQFTISDTVINPIRVMKQKIIGR